MRVAHLIGHGSSYRFCACVADVPRHWARLVIPSSAEDSIVVCPAH